MSENEFVQLLISASIECNIDECRKPMKIYEELGCKPIYGSKSCCPKRFECPDDVKIIKDEDKCTYQGVAFKIGEVLPRKFTNESKCLEACVCSSRFDVNFFLFLCVRGLNYLLMIDSTTLFSNSRFVQADMKRRRPSLCAKTATVAFRASKCLAALTFSVT